MKKSVWPRGKRIPKFSSYEEEPKFWHAHDFEEDASEAGWDEVLRSETLDLDAADVRALRKIAKRRGVSVRRVLEQFIREGIRKAS